MCDDECHSVNLNAHAPHTACQWCCCIVSYCPTLFVIALVGYIAGSYIIWAFGLLLAHELIGLLYFTVCTVLVGLLLASYGRCVVGSPGYVPQTWEVTVSEKLRIANLIPPEMAHVSPTQVSRAMMVEHKLSGKLRYCRKCKIFKPDRSHHCSDCQRCVCKMDHHCPWINNCVGYNNQKFFALFLMYIPVCALWMCATGAYWFSTHKSFSDIDGWDINFLVSLVFAGLVGIVLGGFFGFHARLILTNQTTIENLDNISTNCFDMGYRNNWNQVFGASPWLWFIPVSTTIGDGLLYDSIHFSKLKDQLVV